MIAIVSDTVPCLAENRLENLGYDVHKLPPHPALPSPIASHPDMLLFFAPDAILCTRSYAAVAKWELNRIQRATGLSIRPIAEDYGPCYPHDILLNAARVGDRLFCLPSHTSKAILDLPHQRICAVRQGYAKCSTVPIGAHAMITEDPSITDAAKKNGVEVLQISPGNVQLQGYDTGFLGGACSFAPYGDWNTLLVCGALDLHKDAQRVRAFLDRYGVSPISLTDAPPVDVGTIFII